MPNKRKVVAGPVAAFPPGSARRVDIEGRGIAVFNAGGRFYALRDVCPHQGARFSSGVVISPITASCPGSYTVHGDRKLVRCPWHGWEYDLATGQSWSDPAHSRVRAFPTSVEAGAELAGRVPGPYVAETVAISVQDDYVVVEV